MQLVNIIEGYALYVIKILKLISFSVSFPISSSSIVIVMMNKVFNFFASSKDEAVGKPQSSTSNYDLMLAIEKTRNFLCSNGVSLYDICLAVECAESRSTLEAALVPFNRILRIFRTAVPDPEEKSIVLDALTKLNCTKRLIKCIRSAANIHDGILCYKTTVVKKLNVYIGRMEDLRRSDNAFDQILLTSHLPERALTLTGLDRTMEGKDNQNKAALTTSPVQKRAISLILGGVNESHHEDSTRGHSASFTDVHENHRSTRKRERSRYSDHSGRTKDMDRDHRCQQYISGNCRRGQKCRRIH